MPTPPTAAETESILIRELLWENWSPMAIAGFLIASRMHGILRPNCPDWKRASLTASFALANHPSLAELETTARIVDRLQVAMMESGKHPAQIRRAADGVAPGF